MTTTIRELRSILFNVTNQDMTVAELRAALFNAENQDDELEVSFGMFLKIEADMKKSLEAGGEFPIA